MGYVSCDQHVTAYTVTLDLPNGFPSLSRTNIPSINSLCLTVDMLITLAEDTAAKGTHLTKMGGAF